MSVYRLVLAYDGAPFHGFARQPGLATVQGAVEDALSKITGQQVKTSGAGRTDAGVHALGQVMSFIHPTELDVEDVAKRINSICGPAIAVSEMAAAPEGFDARFSAVARSYEYAIFTRQVVDPFSRHTTWHHPQELDVESMDKAAQALLGEHDFDSFGRIEEGQSPTRTLESVAVARLHDLVTVNITANSFIQQMVRSIVGTLVKVGTGAIHPDDMGDILAARDRSKAGPVAPAHGLFLVSVTYPEDLV